MLMPDFAVEIAARVKQAREQSPYKTQTAIAKEMGVQRDAYAKWETTTPIPSIHIPKFCELMNITERWLLTGKAPMRPNAAYDVFSKIMADLDTKERNRALEALEMWASGAKLRRVEEAPQDKKLR